MRRQVADIKSHYQFTLNAVSLVNSARYNYHNYNQSSTSCRESRLYDPQKLLFQKLELRVFHSAEDFIFLTVKPFNSRWKMKKKINLLVKRKNFKVKENKIKC
jgi:hypothetical protein